MSLRSARSMFWVIADGRLADLPVAFQFLEAVAVGLQPLGAPEPLEAARVDRLVEQAVVILLAIDAAAGDAFGVERLR